MDDQRFDQITRSLAQALTRRRMVRGVAATIGAGALAALGVGSAAAKGSKCYGTGSKCKKAGDCCSPLACVNGKCASTGSGGGGGACAVNSDCPDDGNFCTASVCDGNPQRCVNVAVVRGTPCGDRSFCADGTCIFCDPAQGLDLCYCDNTGTICSANPGAGTFAVCIATNAGDPYNCGACGNRCAEGFGCCGGLCVDLFTPSNCGGCGNACPTGPDEPCCAPFFGPNSGDCGFVCDGFCTYVHDNDAHCGSCGNACSGATPRCDDTVCQD
jgi:hypothetical protein